MTSPKIAAIVPCYNEEAAIGKVIADLRRVMPQMEVFVYDNASTDETARVASQAGAVVRSETSKGKGNVVRRAFADIDADVYLMIDGDDTYEAEAAPRMVQTLLEGPFDHVLGCRVDDENDTAYRKGHAEGNKAFNTLVSFLFGAQVSDMLSGYRVFSRRFVKSFPALSREFEIETELTIHSMALRVPQTEVPVGFKDRPAGSESKLRTFRDGFRILSLVGRLFVHERPALFYGVLSALAFIVGIALGIPVVMEYANSGLVPRFPTAVLASSLVLLAVLLAAIGLILSGVLKARREAMRLAYLRYEAPVQSI